jgi:hypothetical protein
MEPETMSVSDSVLLPVTEPLRNGANTTLEHRIRLEACRELERIVVRTRRSVYEIIVLSGKAGDVLVRGGRFFPKFRQATVTGSIFGGCGVELGSISVGLHLELQCGGGSFLTSQIVAVSRIALS